jgi:hypothetical protein
MIVTIFIVLEPVRFKTLLTGFGKDWKASISNDSLAKLVQVTDTGWKQEIPKRF